MSYLVDSNSGYLVSVDTRGFPIAPGEPPYTIPLSADTLAAIAAAVNAAVGGGGGISLVSPAFSGNPTAPTATAGDTDTTIANTQFVATAIANAVAALINGAPGTLDQINELAAAIGNDPNYATTIVNSLALKAPYASPTFTGTVTLPAISGTSLNTNQAATAAFVQAVAALKVNTSLQINGHSLTGNFSITSSDVGAMPAPNIGTQPTRYLGYYTTAPTSAPGGLVDGDSFDLVSP